jgi:hypothetical protein
VLLRNATLQPRPQPKFDRRVMLVALLLSVLALFVTAWLEDYVAQKISAFPRIDKTPGGSRTPFG